MSIRKNPTPSVLVLGSTGMVGRIVVAHLRKEYGKQVFASSRERGSSYYFDAHDPEKWFRKVYKKTGRVEYVINCIGKLRTYPLNTMVGKEEEYIATNSLLPHVLERLSFELGFRVVHISTDAVFSPRSGSIDESSVPSADDMYSSSKLLGEVTANNCLSIRTSFIGFNPHHGAGLIELVKANKNKVVTGFSNQKWTGCTTLQFAHFVEWLMRGKNFDRLRSQTPIIHFVPLGPVSKYKILTEISLKLGSDTEVKKSKGDVVTRTLQSKYDDVFQLTSYGDQLRIALQEVISFEKTLVKDII